MQKDAVLHHMQNWCVLGRHTLNAEFPSFDVIIAFSVFQLPRQRQLSRAKPLSMQQKQKLKRLAQTFQKRTLEAEYLEHLSYAIAAYADSHFEITYWDAWLTSIQKVERIARHVAGSSTIGLKFVVHRGICWLPVTSKIETSFSQVNARLGEQRLSASIAQEARTVGLLVANYTEAEIDRLATKAQGVWQQAFPDTMVRTHKRFREDRGIPKSKMVCEEVASTDAPTERRFLKKLRASIARGTTLGDAAVLDEYEPIGWTPAHEKELVFQQKNWKAERLKQATIIRFCQRSKLMN